MAGAERPNGNERQDPLANTKRIVDLVFRLPIDPSRSEQVVDAVGTVYADLRILDERRRLDRQLARGLTPDDVDLAIANVHEAASLRPADELATEQRMLVLAGLERIRQATLFNESVGQQGQDGIAIVQIGITSRHVESVMTDVQDAKQLIEESQPKATPNFDISESFSTNVLDHEQEPRIQQPETVHEPIQDIVDVSTPLRTQELDEDILDRIDTEGTNRYGIPSPFSRIPRVSGRRAFLSAVGAAALVLTLGSQVDPENFNKPPLTEDEKKAEDEQYIREHSLTEDPVIDNRGWSVAYPKLQEGESFEDIFKGNFRQLYVGPNAFPIYTLQGESTPLEKNNANFKEGMNMRLGMSTSDFRDPLPTIQVADSSFNGTFNPLWTGVPTVVVSGRKNPDSPEERPFPNVVQFTHSVSRETHYLQLKAVPKIGKDGKPLQYSTDGTYITEITYMKKVKKN